MENMIWQVVKRTMLAALGVVATVFFVVLDAMPYGGGHGPFMLAVTVALFFALWIWLPLIRASRVFGVVALLAWVALGIELANTGGPNPGWQLQPYGLASAAIILCLVLGPPAYFRAGVAQPPQDDQDGRGKG